MSLRTEVMILREIVGQLRPSIADKVQGVISRLEIAAGILEFEAKVHVINVKVVKYVGDTASCGVDIEALERAEHEASAQQIFSPAGSTEQPTPCLWTPDEDGVFDTACGGRWFFDTGTPAENKARFCMYCGAPLLDSRTLVRRQRS